MAPSSSYFTNKQFIRSQVSVGYYVTYVWSDSPRKDNSTEQVKCPKGHYCLGLPKGVKLSCPPGKYANHTGQSACDECEGGTYADKNASKVCTPCDEDVVCAPGSASSKGSLCPRGQVFNDDDKTCRTCSAGTYSWDSEENKCKQCPPGGDCTGGDIVMAEKGYWGDPKKRGDPVSPNHSTFCTV